MSLFDGKPIKRVDFSSKPQPAEPMPHVFAGYGYVCTACGASQDGVLDNLAPRSCPGAAPVPKAEQDRIWRATKATAEGSNIRAAEPSEWAR